MTSLSAIAPIAKTNEVEIKGALYAVEAIAPGECGTSAVRLTKLISGESYDLLRTRENVVECSCPDFVCRHEGKGTVCKHGAAMVARGFLPPAPVAEPVTAAPRPEVAPITRKDLVRASYFGLKLPVAPAAIEAPAPVVVVEPARPLDLSSLVIVVAGSSEVVSVRTTSPRPADVREMAEWLAVNFPAPVVEVQPTPDPVVEHRPTRTGRFTPTPEMELEHLGYTLGRDGEEAAAPGGRSFPELVAFYGGWLAGKADRDAEYDAWLDSVEADRQRMHDAFCGPEDSWNAAELAEAGSRSGHPAFEG